MNLTKFLRTSAAALGALAVASTGAYAADIYTGGGMKEAPYIPPPMWTGFYIGAHVGAAWENFSFNRHRFDDGGKGCEGGCLFNNGNTYIYHPAILNGETRNTAEAFGGGQFGYNYQVSPAWVFGVEVDLGGMSLNPFHHVRGATSWTDANGHLMQGWGTPVEFDGEGNGGFYGDVTGRLGYTWGPAMLYVKGGFAFLNANLNLHEHAFDGTVWHDFNHNNDNTLTGWTLGGGLEWKVSPAWSIKVEYLHFDFTNFNNNCCNDWGSLGGSWSNNLNNHADLQVDTVKLGFNYFWAPAAPAPLK